MPEEGAEIDPLLLYPRAGVGVPREGDETHTVEGEPEDVAGGGGAAEDSEGDDRGADGGRLEKMEAGGGGVGVHDVEVNRGFAGEDDAP